MARVWSSQVYKASFNTALIAAEAYRDEERIRFNAKSKKWKNNTTGHARQRAHFEKRQAALSKTIDALREASVL